jgi:hypothetical protein
LKKYSILAEEQFGFRADSSTGNAIYKIINESLQALISKSPVGGITFYFEKALDCLNHDISIQEQESVFCLWCKSEIRQVDLCKVTVKTRITYRIYEKIWRN